MMQEIFERGNQLLFYIKVINVPLFLLQSYFTCHKLPYYFCHSTKQRLVKLFHMAPSSFPILTSCLNIKIINSLEYEGMHYLKHQDEAPLSMWGVWKLLHNPFRLNIFIIIFQIQSFEIIMLDLIGVRLLATFCADPPKFK